MAPRGAQAAAVGRVKLDHILEYSPKTRPGARMHVPSAAWETTQRAATESYLVLKIAQKKDEGIFKTAHEQPPSSPACGFLTLNRIDDHVFT